MFRVDLTEKRRTAPDEATTRCSLLAPMPATVVSILVKQGDAVTQGQTLVLLDAMKMELPIRAPADGVVTSVHCREGDLVEADAVLLELIA